jgi:hypothetical protein
VKPIYAREGLASGGAALIHPPPGASPWARLVRQRALGAPIALDSTALRARIRRTCISCPSWSAIPPGLEHRRQMDSASTPPSLPPPARCRGRPVLLAARAFPAATVTPRIICAAPFAVRHAKSPSLISRCPDAKRPVLPPVCMLPSGPVGFMVLPTRGSILSHKLGGPRTLMTWSGGESEKSAAN